MKRKKISFSLWIILIFFILFILFELLSFSEDIQKRIANPLLRKFSFLSHKIGNLSSFFKSKDELLKETYTRKSNLHDSNAKIQVMLMSEDDEQKKLHYYIFSSSADVDYYTIDILPEDEMSILTDMDIIIYNKK